MIHGKGQQLLHRLLLRDMSVAQLAVYAVGVYLGVLILSGALQFWRDFSVRPADAADPFSSEDYVIFSPQVSGLGFGSGVAADDSLLRALRAQPWVTSADRFTAADFSVAASVDLGTDRFASALFFEAVPDEYMTPLPDAWTFDSTAAAPVIPVILPRDYLALYNFGFAPSRGLPSLGEDVVMQIPLTVSVAGNGRQRLFAARVVGFSNRINTIAVPQSFISWGNGIFGEGSGTNSSARLIARVSTDRNDPAIKDFAAARSLEIAGDSGSVSASRVLAVIMAIVSGVGLLLCILSGVILTVSLILLLYKTRSVISRLISLGFTRRSILSVYALMLALVNAVVWIAVAVTLVAGHRAIDGMLHDAGAGTATLLPVLGASLLLMSVVQLLGMTVISSKIKL
ncbi:MAG: hypothetical protein K2K76_00190 [Muribaculaceae bacterium]|nr:hypothetical protein [Muribaculaceae bacterium]